MIREAKIEDLPAILSIYNDAILHTTAVYTYDVQTLDERKAWFDMKNKANEPIFVFEQVARLLVLRLTVNLETGRLIYILLNILFT